MKWYTYDFYRFICMWGPGAGGPSESLRNSDLADDMSVTVTLASRWCNHFPTSEEPGSLPMWLHFSRGEEQAMPSIAIQPKSHCSVEPALIRYRSFLSPGQKFWDPSFLFDKCWECQPPVQLSGTLKLQVHFSHWMCTSSQLQLRLYILFLKCCCLSTWCEGSEVIFSDHHFPTQLSQEVLWNKLVGVTAVVPQPLRAK